MALGDGRRRRPRRVDERVHLGVVEDRGLVANLEELEEAEALVVPGGVAERLGAREGLEDGEPAQGLEEVDAGESIRSLSRIPTLSE